MKNISNLSLGWKEVQIHNRAMMRKKSQIDFWLSIIIAFLIIFVISQLLMQVDRLINAPLKNNFFTLINPFEINIAQAAEDETFKMIQSHREINIVKGVGFTFEVGFKNKTNYTWVQTGSNSVDLKLAPPYNRDTVVRHKFWRDTQTPAWLKDSQAKPGWLAYYQFALEAPKEVGAYKEKFVLVNYGNGHVLSGSEFEITLNVWNSTAEFPKNNTSANNTSPSVTATTPTVNVTPPPAPAENKQAELTDQMKLGRTCLELSVKKFVISTTVPMSLVEECKRIGVDLYDNIYIDPQTTNESSTTTTTNTTADSNSNNTSTTTTTTTTNNTGNGPLIRVGLYSTTDPIVITANSAYKILDQNKNILAAVPANIQATVNFNFSTKTYSFSANGNSMATSAYIRFESENSANIMEIVSLDKRPAWNLSLNDNKFLGSLEIRYSSNTGKLWVINELDLENYLKGIAETSNNSPMEYQKALITAARTYAMYHYNRGTKHASEYFTVDATYDQVYRGYNSQIRLPNVSLAVDQTKGMMITYNNQVVVTPYFSHSDGHTRNWEDVWGGSAIAWCRSVKEPAGYTKTTLYGHGVGLSAYGAMLLANDYAYTYDRILKYYYTGIEVTKIY